MQTSLNLEIIVKRIVRKLKGATIYEKHSFQYHDQQFNLSTYDGGVLIKVDDGSGLMGSFYHSSCPSEKSNIKDIVEFIANHVKREY